MQIIVRSLEQQVLVKRLQSPLESMLVTIIKYTNSYFWIVYIVIDFADDKHDDYFYTGVDLVAAVLQWPTGSDAVAQWGCSAIHMLAINHKDHQIRLAQVILVPAIVEFIVAYDLNFS